MMIDFYRLRGGSSEKEKLFNRTILYPSLDVHHLVHPSSISSEQQQQPIEIDTRYRLYKELYGLRIVYEEAAAVTATTD